MITMFATMPVESGRIEPDGDLAVDVLVVGSGIQGLYVAQSLRSTYSVCVLSNPSVRPETLDSPGLISAGYDGNDVNRIQPARRAAASWRLWAQANDVAHDEVDRIWSLRDEERSIRLRTWDDAVLGYRRVDDPPAILDGGSLAGTSTYSLDDDVTIEPGRMLTRLRSGIEDRCLQGEIVRFGLVADRYVDHVLVDLGASSVAVVPRYVVLAAGVGNADLLSAMSARIGDLDMRKAGHETARTCQAVQLSTVVAVCGSQLPALSGWFGDLSIVTHGMPETDETVWLVSGPVDDAFTTLGPQDVRFEVPVDSNEVASAVESLFACMPSLRDMAGSLRWGTYRSRRTRHPMLAVADSSAVGQPVPAKLEALGLDSMLALWPSQLGYSMVLGDVVAERIADALGEPGDFSDSVRPAELAVDPQPFRSRWERDDMRWDDWTTFRSSHVIR